MLLILITNAIEPYYKEVVNVLAQPRGSRYWFRYERKHITEIIDWPTINGSPGIIILRDPNNGMLYPMRAVRDARVDELADDAPIIPVDFCVGGFPPDPEILHDLWNDSRFSSLLKRSREETTNVGTLSLVSAIDLGEERQKILTSLLEGPASSIGDVTRWVKTIETVKDITAMKKSCFLYLRDVQDQQGKSLKLGNTRRFLSATAGTYYVAKVSQYCPANSGLAKISSGAPDALEIPIPIDMSSDHDQIRILEGKHNLDGRYDECQLTFKTETDAAGASTVITIGRSENFAGQSVAASVRADEKLPDLAYVPTITADIEIQRAPWQNAILFTGVFLLLAGFTLNVDVTDAPVGVIPSFWQYLKHFQIFTMMIAMGATLTTWLGKDFWASIFRHNMWLWSSIVFGADNWLMITSTLVFLFGLLGWSTAAKHSFAELVWFRFTIGFGIIWVATVAAKFYPRRKGMRT